MEDDAEAIRSYACGVVTHRSVENQMEKTVERGVGSRNVVVHT